MKYLALTSIFYKAYETERKLYQIMSKKIEWKHEIL